MEVKNHGYIIGPTNAVSALFPTGKPTTAGAKKAVAAALKSTLKKKP